MKKSIILAFLTFLVTAGWLASGQIGNNKDKENKIVSKKNEIEDKKVEINDENTLNLIKVETKMFNAEKIDQSIMLQGQTIYNKKIDVKSETVGNITEINFKRGDQVQKGSKLIKISDENRKELLDSAKKLIKLYEIEYSSAKKLVDQGLSSKSKLGLASYNLANAESQLKDIELSIDNTNIRSPFSGIITSKNVEISEYVNQGTILFTIVNLNPIKIQGYLSEFDVNKIKIKTKAHITNSNGLKKDGKITFISPIAETNTRTFEIEIEADNSDLVFKSGITTTITIDGSDLLAHKIPPSILTLKDNGTIGVKALNNINKVIFYPIQKVRDTVDGMWVSGLPNEVNLIISGQEYVKSGQIVKIK